MNIKDNQVTLSIKELVEFAQLLRDEASDSIEPDWGSYASGNPYLASFDPKERVERWLAERTISPALALGLDETEVTCIQICARCGAKMLIDPIARMSVCPKCEGERETLMDIGSDRER